MLSWVLYGLLTLVVLLLMVCTGKRLIPLVQFMPSLVGWRSTHLFNDPEKPRIFSISFLIVRITLLPTWLFAEICNHIRNLESPDEVYMRKLPEIRAAKQEAIDEAQKTTDQWAKDRIESAEAQMMKAQQRRREVESALREAEVTIKTLTKMLEGSTNEKTSTNETASTKN